MQTAQADPDSTCSRCTNPLPNDKFLPNCNSWQTTILYLMKMTDSSPKKVENTMEKGEIACYKEFPSPAVFSKILYCTHVKTRACL